MATVLIVTLQFGTSVLAECPLDQKGDLPPIVYSNLTTHNPAYPTFVSADSAVHPDGTVNAKLFHPDIVSALESILEQTPEDGCIRTEEVWWDPLDVPDRPSLSTAARESALTLVGTVVSKEYGFHLAEAGQLVEVLVDESFRGEERERVLTFLPVGDFTAGPYSICKIDRRYVAPPDVGDQVVLMAPRSEDVGDVYLDLVDGAGLVVFGKNGTVRAPKEFTESLDRKVLDRQEVLQILQTSLDPEIREEGN